MRVLPVLLAGLTGSVGLTLALQHPLGGLVAGLAFVLAMAGAFAAPGGWLIVLPAALPWLGLAPWSGWQGIEELDLLVLAAAAGGYARLASQAARERYSVSLLVSFMVLLFAASTLLAMTRGVADAGGWHLGWYQGLRDPLASVRLAKGLFEALLLWPLWRSLHRSSTETATAQLTTGMAMGLAGACLAALWERLAFTGLLDFSSDYRTTALFWEMHVGGAALDGFLALTLPFAVRELLVARGHVRWCLAAATLVLAGYACLTTFSRGVYLGVTLGLIAMALLEQARRRRTGSARATERGWWSGTLLVITFLCAAAWIFPTSGYRGLLALLGATAVLLPLGTLLSTLRRGEWLGGIASGMVLSGLAVATAWLLPKGAYVVFSAGVLFALALLARLRNRPSQRTAPTSLIAGAFAGFMWVVTGFGLVALHWGGGSALLGAAPVMVLLLAGAAACGLARQGSASPWPSDARWQGTVMTAMLLCGGVVGALSGGVYMTDRFAASGSDLEGRHQHWRDGLSLLREPMEWTFGVGLGRFPARYVLAARENERPGDYNLGSDSNGTFLAISSGTHSNGWGEVFRVSQRVGPPIGPTKARFRVRAEHPVTLHLEVCEKHLLYSANCLFHQIAVMARPGQWQTFETPLNGSTPTRGTAYAPRLIAFSIAIETPGRRAEIDNISLVDGSGRDLLANGDFSQGLAHWFSSSDRIHLPWHAKNMALHVLIEQGMLGLALLAALVAGAAWRMSAGHTREHPLTPAIAGALVGFMVVGLFDSLLDGARVGFLFYFLLLIGLTLRAPVASIAVPAQRRTAPSKASLAMRCVALTLVAWPVPADANAPIRVGTDRELKTLIWLLSVKSPHEFLCARSGDRYPLPDGERDGALVCYPFKVCDGCSC